MNDFSKELNALAHIASKAKTPDGSAIASILEILANKRTDELFEILENLESVNR